MKDEGGGYPGNQGGIKGGKTSPLPGASLGADGSQRGNTGDIEQAEDHEGKGNKWRPAKLGGDSSTQNPLLNGEYCAHSAHYHLLG